MRAEIIYGGLVSILIGLIFYIISKFENIKNSDMVFSEFIGGTGLMIMVLGLIVTVYGFIFYFYKQPT